MGHLTRVMALADAFGASGRRATVLAREDAAARKLLEGAAASFEFLVADAGPGRDAAETRQAAERLRAEVIVTDICDAARLRDCHAIAEFHSQLKQSGALVVCLGGANYVDAAADIAITPYVGSDSLKPSTRADQICLLGPAYFIFRREFADIALLERRIAPRAERLLVTIGGADPSELTLHVVRALAEIDHADLDVRIVVGSGFSNGYCAALRAVTGACALRVEYLINPQNMARLMHWADLAVTGDGLTKYETAVTGTPSIMLSRHDSPHSLNADFARTGAVIHLGPADYVKPGVLARTIEVVRDDAQGRHRMSRQGKALLDGKGIERVMAAIEGALKHAE